ncbi:MAG TPA: type VI secretion system-associated FHA domain protein TagH [Pseudomonas sp.]|uniref:type VI secretion system-associated FHA domain protein TagH n=1 Tax=Pseudomonas sp. TaxID=306 RepID=UPI002C01AA69|nr:type VI secretion system-associated FHA domain protein TagH [Pseudomonas sp.]HTO17802.1 type VI secretion system-associated FHA domain protein TagH [Pseudomonas sp.]
MELVFERVGAGAADSSARFTPRGGVIGRAADCDWVIADSKRVISGRHARVSHRDGDYFLTDTSSNGIRLKDNGASLIKGVPQKIEHGAVFCLGEVEIRARLVPGMEEDALLASASIIPDDAFLELDPLAGLDATAADTAAHGLDLSLSLAASEAPQRDYAAVEAESLLVPRLVPAATATAADMPAPAHPNRDDFWQRLGETLGMQLEPLDEPARQAVALQAARLLRQCVGQLQQSLRTRSELKGELRLQQTSVQSAGNNPLKHAVNSEEALQALLRTAKPGQLKGEQAVARAFRDLQAHQVAMLAASRAAVQAMFEHFAPERIAARSDQDRKPWLTTAGSRWRAYRRQHRQLGQDGDWGERLFARDFAQAYEEQVRLIATLNTDSQG